MHLPREPQAKCTACFCSNNLPTRGLVPSMSLRRSNHYGCPGWFTFLPSKPTAAIQSGAVPVSYQDSGTTLWI